MFQRLALSTPPEHRPLSEAELEAVHSVIGRIFSRLGLDVRFTSHFRDRCNDARNGKQITPTELANFFNDAYKAYGPKIAKMSDGQEAVLADRDNDLNIPFVIEHNPRTHALEMISKTIMRKRNFRSPDPILQFKHQG